MREQIHTIPVLDALREPGACVFCTIWAKLENNALDFVMGEAYMDERTRNETNKAGFCSAHMGKMYKRQNRLGAALQWHTHLLLVRKMVDSAKNAGSSRKLSAQIDAMQKRCYLCEKINGTFKKYLDTFCWLWSKEPEAAKLVRGLPGFCLPHFGEMLKAAEGALGKRDLEAFLAEVLPIQQRALAKMDADLDWFTQKFDFRNADAPWKDSKDALPRTMFMLKGGDHEG